MSAGALVVPSQLERRLAAITTVEEAKAVRDEAEVLRQLARRVGANLVTQNRVALIRVLAEHRGGELLHDRALRPGPKADAFTLKGIGLSWAASHRWQTIARLLESTIRALAAQFTDAGHEFTSTFVYQFARQCAKWRLPSLPGVAWHAATQCQRAEERRRLQEVMTLGPGRWLRPAKRLVARIPFEHSADLTRFWALLQRHHAAGDPGPFLLRLLEQYDGALR